MKNPNSVWCDGLIERVHEEDYFEKMIKIEDAEFIKEIEKIKELEKKAMFLIIRADKCQKKGQLEGYQFYFNEAEKLIRQIYNEELKAGKLREQIIKIEAGYEQYKNKFIEKALVMMRDMETRKRNKTEVNPEYIKKEKLF
jgi:hypothetical protein